MSPVYRRRLANIKRQLQRCGAERAVMLLGSAAKRPSSADQHFPFRQNSDVLFLTGSEDSDLLLLIDSAGKRPLLLVPPISKTAVLWEGRPPNRQELADSIGAELVVSPNLTREALSRLKGVTRLYYQNDSGSFAASLAAQVFERAPHARNGLPQELFHAHQLLQPLRLHKDPSEVKLIREAAEVTNAALFEVLPCITPGVSEHFIASSIDFFFRSRECGNAFDTNVSTGSSGAVLHHSPGARALKNGDLVLIDCGAAKAHYAADITRVLPVNRTFSAEQRIAYQGVLAAQKAAIRKVRHGVLLRDVYLAAASALTDALIELKVLRGKRSTLMARKAYQPYFPHGIGHTLGLDVHDVGDLRGNNSARLEKGMVFTIEPGLYFSKRVGKVPALGIRIEDDVLVTSRGCEVLTAGFPKEISEVEALP